MRTRHEPEPQIRTGNCCGCQQFHLLFKVANTYRYRCAVCFRREEGYDHSLCVRVFQVRPVQRVYAGGPLYAPVDQFDEESGDEPSDDTGAIARRCEDLNLKGLYAGLPDGSYEIIRGNKLMGVMNARSAETAWKAYCGTFFATRQPERSAHYVRRVSGTILPSSRNLPHDPKECGLCAMVARGALRVIADHEPMAPTESPR